MLTGAIRSVPNRVTDFTPNLLMLGREVRLPGDLFAPAQDKEFPEPCAFVKDLQERFHNIHNVVWDAHTLVRRKDILVLILTTANNTSNVKGIHVVTS